MAIVQNSVNMNGEWELATALTMSKFKSELSAFIADTTMGLSKKEPTKQDYKCPFYFYDAYGTEKGKITLGVTGCEAYLDSVSLVTTDTNLIKFMTGEATDGEAAKDENEATWTAKLSCQLGEDTFQFVFHRDYLVIQNYSDEATATAVATYLATRPNLAQKASA